MQRALLAPPAPLSAVGAAPAVDLTVRLWLDPTIKRQGTSDGVWWPYSRDAATELPRLIAEVDRRMGRTTRRVDLHPDSWTDIPYRISARGREIEVRCRRGTDPHVVVLTFAEAGSVTLLVSAPDTAPDTASDAAPDNLATTDTLDWENEGGRVLDDPPDPRPTDQIPAPRPQPTCHAVRTREAQTAAQVAKRTSRSRMTVTDDCPLGRADRSAATTVRLSGEIDVFTSPALRTCLLNTLESSTDVLVLDLSGVSFCDAAGLAVMVGIQRRARPLGITLALAAPRPPMSRLLHITGLDRSLPVI